MDTNPDLESFREQWRAEVRARNSGASGTQQRSTTSGHAESSRASAPRASRTKLRVQDTDEDHVEARTFDAPEPGQEMKQDDLENREPVTALEHYERAVEKEDQGSLGDSLHLYRRAFRMDHKVDQKYKNKYHAAAWARPLQADSEAATPSAEESTRSSTERKPLTTEELIASFADLSIEPAQPIIKGMPESPCPIAKLPEEIIVHILKDVAVADVGAFVRLSRVCKRLAWLVATEDSIWRLICLGPKFGFRGMHYSFATAADWKPLAEERTLLDDPHEDVRRHEEQAYATSIALLNTTYHSWQKMFRRRPRIRFNGCYISTINYIRPGQQTNSLAWNSPVHIVTYYRYLRMFRDGTAITLCTVEQPANVVHHMTREALTLHKGGAMAHLPSGVMQHAHRARWRLSSAADHSADLDEGQEVSLADSEGDLFIEYDGGGNYLYRMDLSLRTTGKLSRNNKLLWSGFYSYNKPEDVWDEFSLKEFKPFYFSRVKSYGFGGPE